MSARVFAFRPQSVEEEHLYSGADPDRVREHTDQNAARNLPSDVLYHIFCSDDDFLQDMAMEYFLLEGD